MGKESLGEFELLVLLAVLRLGDEDAYSLAIADEIHERTGRNVRRSAVQMTLKRLERKGHISTWLGEPKSERGGKSRRHVHVEPSGAAAIHEMRTAFERMWGSLDTTVETG